MNSSSNTSRSVHDLCIWTNHQDVWVAAASADALVKLWAKSSNCCLAELQGHTDQVTCVRCSPDGQFIASASLDRTVCIWTLQTSVSTAWQKLVVLKNHTGRVTCLCFTPDGRHLLTGSTDTTVQVWCCNSWKCIATMQGHTGMVTALDVLSCNQWAASASGDGSCLLWHIPSGSVEHKLEADSGGVTGCWFVPSGPLCKADKTVATAHFDRKRNQARVLLWDLSVGGRNWVDGTILGHFKAVDGFAGKILAVTFTAAGAISSSGSPGMMAMSCADCTVQVMDMADLTIMYCLSLAECADVMHQPGSRNRSQTGHHILAAFSLCGTWLATVGFTHVSRVQIWDAETGTLTESVAGSGNAVTVFKWALDKGGRQMLVLGDVAGDCTFHRWECGNSIELPEPAIARLDAHSAA